jgi:hypothetical protein
MPKPANLDAPREKSPDASAGVGLSWREFFVRLGNGTLHAHAADQACRDTADQHRKIRARQSAPASR